MANATVNYFKIFYEISNTRVWRNILWILQQAKSYKIFDWFCNCLVSENVFMDLKTVKSFKQADGFLQQSSLIKCLMCLQQPSLTKY